MVNFQRLVYCVYNFDLLLIRSDSAFGASCQGEYRSNQTNQYQSVRKHLAIKEQQQRKAEQSQPSATRDFGGVGLVVSDSEIDCLSK